MGIKLITKNKKAFFKYNIIEKMEAGIVLVGSEVKSLRNGNANLSDAYALIKNGEGFLVNLHIGIYNPASIFNHNPKRNRKLLLHRTEIGHLKEKLEKKGLTLVPLSLYFKEGKVKVELGLATGKKLFDKREAVKKREIERDLKRAMKK